MFKIGKRYEFVLIRGGEETTSWGTIEKYEHPLIKLADVGPLVLEFLDAQTGQLTSQQITDRSIPGEIINITSPLFARAALHAR